MQTMQALLGKSSTIFNSLLCTNYPGVWQLIIKQIETLAVPFGKIFDGDGLCDISEMI